MSDILNGVLAVETPPNSVSSNQEAARFIYLSTAIGFPAMILVFLLERFKESKGMNRRFATCLTEVVARRGKSSIHIVKMKHMIGHGQINGFKLSNGETRDAAILRHIRNALAHGYYTYKVAKSPTSEGRIYLIDYDPKQGWSDDKRTFQADMEIELLPELAEKMLLVAHKKL